MRAYLIASLLLSLPVGAATVLHVAPGGRDTNPGTVAAPLATLEGARDHIRALKAVAGPPGVDVAVELAAGTYELARPLALTAQDSGRDGSPIVYRAKTGAEVRLVGGKVVSGWHPVTDAAVLARLDPAARGKVLGADLHALGLTDLPGIKISGQWATSTPGVELFFADKPMTLSRWPNDGFTRIADVVSEKPVDVRGTKGDSGGKFIYQGDRPSRWTAEPEVWLHGYWFWDWADERQKVASIDAEHHQITLAPPLHSYGFRKNQWYYATNLLCELDQPGEYYVDRQAGQIYFWPPAPITSGKALVSVQTGLVTLEHVSHVELRGLTLEACRGTAVTGSDVDGVQVVACTIRNTGAWAVSLSGWRSGVTGCDIYATGDGGISLTGGDRKTLTRSELVADNNHIHHYSRWNPVYKPGVMMQGVGIRCSHNLIHNAPHMAIGFGGNDNLIELNEIHSVCYESNDAGAMYAGRDWTMRGHVIRNNYLHHIYGFEGRGCVGVYLDDQFSSAEISGNVFNDVTRAAFIGGGRDCSIVNNIFLNCRPALHIDARGLGWANGGRGDLENKLRAMPYQTPPWSERFPQLLTLLTDDPMAPKNDLVARNVCVGGKWDDIEGKARPGVTFKDNVIDDPRLADVERLHFQIRPDIAGFEPIPFDRIGVYQSADRASWPVRHTVRPRPTPPPAPAKPARAAKAPLLRLGQAAATPTVDGVLTAGEWGQALTIEQGVEGEKLSPASRAWVSHDAGGLWLAFDNAVDPAKPLRPGATWGQDDAVEIALKNLAGGKGAGILIWRGYPNGQWQTSDEAGAEAGQVQQAAGGVQYKATVVSPSQWVCEWRIPWAAIGLTPQTATRLAANLSVRKTAGDQWLMWWGTGAHTWDVDEAGVWEVAR